MAAPQFDAVLTALVSTLRAGTGLGAPGDGTTDVPVFDGPVPATTPVRAFVAVGWDGNEELDSDTLSSVSEPWATGSPYQQMETFTAVCWLAVEDGSNDFARLRSSASTTFGLISDALRASSKLGLPAVVQDSRIASYRVRQGVSPRGAYVGIAFDVEALCLI